MNETCHDTKRRWLPLALGLLAPLAPLTWSSEALAGPCLPNADRADFEADLVAAFEASTLTVDQLYDHATSRLGYGWSGPPGTRSREDLATLVADSLALASDTTAAAAIDTQLAAYVAANGSIPYAFADDTMAAMYVEIKNNPASRGKIRALPGVRTIAQALSGPNVDIDTVLREFWFNHFNVYSIKSDWSTVDYQRTIHATQCSSFANLLEATAKHPAMLVYLDNRLSRVGSINENYGRELLELMTFGDDELVWYDQDDVVGAARALTGWTISLANDAPTFSFVAGNHDSQELVLFSGANQLTLAAGSSVARGEQLLDHLANHPATKNNVCTKLVRRLVGRAPATIVNACKAAWGVGGEQDAMLQAILTHPDTWSSASYHKQIKNPLELVISGHRAVGATTLTSSLITKVRNRAEAMGLPVAMVPPPTGYPDTTNGWAGAGASLEWNEHVFVDLSLSNLSLSVNGAAPASGSALESALQTYVATQPGNTALNGILDDMKPMLGLPPTFSLPYAALRLALQNPDVYVSNGSLRPLRTAVHGILTTPAFLRK